VVMGRVLGRLSLVFAATRTLRNRRNRTDLGSQISTSARLAKDVELLFLRSILLPGQCGSRCARVLIILDSNEMVPLAKR